MSKFYFFKKAQDKISIQKPIYQNDNLGGQIIHAWQDILENIWAYIQIQKSEEILEQNQVKYKTTLEIIIHYHDIFKNNNDVNKMRILYQNQLFEIKTIENLSADLSDIGKHYHKIICSKLTN